jgi:Concanavalin A-like lectin/glucanases superfamily
MKRECLSVAAAAAFTITTSLAADVRQGLVSYWPLDNLDLVNLVTPDVVASNNLALFNIVDSTPLVAGKFGQGIAFDRTLQQCAFFTGDTNLDLGLPITRNACYSILFWVNGTGVGQSDLRYFCESAVTNANNNPLYGLGTQAAGTNTSGRVYLRNSGGTVLIDTTTTNAVLDGNWHHVALVYNGGPVTLFVDGKLTYTNNYTRDTTGVWDTTAIGGIVRAAKGSFFSGTMDDVALWARALSQAELQNVMSNSITTPVPPFAPGISLAPSAATNLYVGDSWTFQAGVYGRRPLTYQWLKTGTNVPGATAFSLALTNLATTDSGGYALVVANAQGSVTSAVATLTVNAFTAPNITNGLVAYWPLDTIIGTKTPDLVSGYDMTVVNMTAAANVVPGKWGNAFSFTNATHTILQRVDNPGEDLPLYNKSYFTISMWVNGDPNQTDRRVWSEGSTANNNPLFNLGTTHNGVGGGVDSYIRTDTGAVAAGTTPPGGNHYLSASNAFDDTWHNIVYSQRLAGSTVVAAWYIDGVLDPVVPGPVYPLTLNTTSIGGILRSSPSSWYQGYIDEVAVWNRALSPAEIQVLQVTSITNPPSRLQPLAINSFTVDFPAVVKGGSTVLRWDVSKDAAQLTISPNVGDVTAKTVVGAGTNAVTLTDTTTFVLTVKRGTSTLTATSTVAVVSGVAPGWTLLDNFDFYNPGPLNATAWWRDLRGNSVQIASLGANRVLTTLATDSDAMLNLQTNTLKETQIGTLFFRMIVPVPGATTPVQAVGLTDKNARSYSDIVTSTLGGIGPAIYPTIMVDPTWGTNAWFLGAKNGIAAGTDYTADSLAPGIYDVWIDITNAPMADPVNGFMNDVFSVYLQLEGGFTRTNIFQSYLSDRDPNYVDVIIGGMQPNLDKLFVAGNSASDSVMFDDFYLSTGGYSATVPRGYGYAGGPLPPLQVHFSGGSFQIQWTTGTLQQAPAVTGPWTDVTGATPPSYTVAPTGGRQFFRARQ